MDFPVFENVTRPIRAGPFSEADLFSIYMIRVLVLLMVGHSMSKSPIVSGTDDNQKALSAFRVSDLIASAIWR